MANKKLTIEQAITLSKETAARWAQEGNPTRKKETREGNNDRDDIFGEITNPLDIDFSEDTEYWDEMWDAISKLDFATDIDVETEMK